MKRFVLTLAFVSSLLMVSAQHKDDLMNAGIVQGKPDKDKEKCDTRVERTDSVINYSYDSVTGQYTPYQLTVYSYNSNYNVTDVYVMKLPERTYIYRQLFEYDINRNQIRYNYFQYNAGAWDQTLKVEKFYDLSNNIISEIYYNKDASGNLQQYMRHYYHYQNGRISDYLRQMKNQAGEWYDFSYHYYIYDSMGRLTVLYGQYVNNGPVYWERTAVYEGNNSYPSSRYLRQLKYDPVQKKNVLTNITYELYTHNIYGNVSEILYHSWVNGAWEISGKAIYHNSLLRNKKVSICHNNRSLCVSASSVITYLENGAILGECPAQPATAGSDTQGSGFSTSFTVYPNPSADFIRIQTGKNQDKYLTGFILNSGGNIVKTFDARNMGEITLDISSLQTGTYIIKILKQNGADSEVLIKN